MNKQKYRAYVCCGPNCGPRGSRGLLDFLDEEVKRLHLEGQVAVAPAGCQTHCVAGPTMVVYPGPVFYQHIDHERIKRIIAEHFVNGEPVGEYFWVDPLQRQAYEDRSRPFRKPGPLPAESKPEPRAPRPKRSYEDVDDFKW